MTSVMSLEGRSESGMPTSDLAVSREPLFIRLLLKLLLLSLHTRGR